MNLIISVGRRRLADRQHKNGHAVKPDSYDKRLFPMLSVYKRLHTDKTQKSNDLQLLRQLLSVREK